jgi:hypothetical protein
MEFITPASTLQCPVPGQCIDHPSTIDLSRLFGSSSSDVALPPHSHILIDDESFQSAWWPVVVVGVKNRGAWNKIVAAKSEAAVQACQAASMCTSDIPANTFLAPGFADVTATVFEVVLVGCAVWSLRPKRSPSRRAIARLAWALPFAVAPVTIAAIISAVGIAGQG